MRPWPLVIPLICLAGCSELIIEGAVQDEAGQAVEGARVALAGTGCEALTDVAGRFSFTCAPGSYAIIVEKAGYIPDSMREVRVAPHATTDLGVRTLLHIPAERGLYVIEGTTLRLLPPGRVSRRMGGSGDSAFKHYCLPEEETPMERLPPGELRLLDNDAPPWRPFRLDSDGCAYKISPRGDNRWDVDYSDNPDVKERKLGVDQRLVTMNLEPGKVFFAVWNREFFTRIEATEEGKEGYAGSLVEISADGRVDAH